MANIAGGVNIASLVLNTTTNSSNSSSGSSGSSFSSVLASAGGMTDDQVGAALENNPDASPLQIFNFMKQSGVDINQLSRVSGKSTSEIASIGNAAGLTNDMMAQIGYASSSSSWVTAAGGVSFGGQAYSPQQIKEFYANGGNDVQFAQEHGVTDPGQIHDLAVAARAIGGAPTGDAALQQVFDQYVASTPNGKYANDFSGWTDDLGAGTRNSIYAGTYTGAAISPTDYDYNGIFGPVRTTA